MENWYTRRPWLGLYPPGGLVDLEVDEGTVLGMFRSSVARAPGRVVLRYFGSTVTMGELDAQSDALACALIQRGFGVGDRLAVYLQNVPAWAVALLAAWKAGGAVVAVNPMNRERELSHVLVDSGARALICHAGLYESVAAAVVGGTGVDSVVVVGERDGQSRDDPRVLGSVGRARSLPGTVLLGEILEGFAGGVPPVRPVGADDVAVLTYTSGTTGAPKGAMNTHRNIRFTTRVYQRWVGLSSADVILGASPLFHVTGLIGHLCLALGFAVPLVLTYRFEPAVIRDAVVEYRPTFTIAAVTAFLSLLTVEGVRPVEFASLTRVYSGGAPIAPAMLERIRRGLGVELRQVYGLTETTSPTHMQPVGRPAPVDQASGVLSVGVPVFNTIVTVEDDAGVVVPPGQVGELVSAGPQVVPGYWRNERATGEAFPGGRLRTGDVGFMSPEGWFFIVDRKKDMINASGFKVWPREVEDVLYTHPAVREAAVVGVPDSYRGETVKAYVSLRPGRQVTPEELVAFCRDRMAAYKYPRHIEILDDIPKTATGKILRRNLR